MGVTLSPEADEKSDERAPRRGLAANGAPESVSIASVSAPASVFSSPIVLLARLAQIARLAFLAFLAFLVQHGRHRGRERGDTPGTEHVIA